jgi:hypothetical protein
MPARGEAYRCYGCRFLLTRWHRKPNGVGKPVTELRRSPPAGANEKAQAALDRRGIAWWTEPRRDTAAPAGPVW